MTCVVGVEEIKDSMLDACLQSIQLVSPESPASPDVFSITDGRFGRYGRCMVHTLAGAAGAWFIWTPENSNALCRIVGIIVSIDFGSFNELCEF